MSDTLRAGRNRTIALTDAERVALSTRLVHLTEPAVPCSLIGRTVCQDLFDALPHLPPGFVDLLIVDPPYNLTKSFNGRSFKHVTDERYECWVDSWIRPLRRVLKESASIYVCCDWRCSSVIQRVGERYFFSAEPNHLGARKGSRGAPKLEELLRGHLVLYDVA